MPAPPAATVALAALLAVGCAGSAPADGASASPGSVSPGGSSGGDDSDRVPGEYVAKLAEGTEPSVLEEAFRRYGVAELERLYRNRYRIRLEEDPGPEVIEQRADEYDAIEVIEPNYRYRPSSGWPPAPAETGPRVEALASGQHCGGPDTAEARWLGDPAALQEALANAGGEAPRRLGNHGAVVIHMGLKPGAGYTLTLADQPWRVSGEVATLGLRWHEPGDDEAAATVLTRPCLIVTVPRGPYHTVRVVDGDARPRLRAAVPHEARRADVD